MLTYGSVCSGIEAASVGWHGLGWRPAFFAEIDRFPSRVLAARFGSNMPGEPLSRNGVPNHGDFTAIPAIAGPVDVLVGGTPCQSFSVAGRRLGLDDPRGNLALEYLALARRLRARWIVWENVPGVLGSTSGGDGDELAASSDFATFLSFVLECGYGFAWRVLDSQHVRTQRFPRAVPQRRRRVFVVGYLGDWRRAAAVLLEPEGMRGDPAPRREAGQGIAPTLAARTRGGGGLGTDFDLDGGLIAGTAGTLCAADGKGANGQDAYDDKLVVQVAHTLRGDGFDASEDGTGRGTPIVAVAERDVAGTVSAKWAKGAGGPAGDEVQNLVAFDAQAGGESGMAIGDIAGALHGGGKHGGRNAIAFQPRFVRNGRGTPEEIAGPLTAEAGRTGKGDSAQVVAFAVQERAVSENPGNGPQGKGWQEDHAYTLEARNKVQAVIAPWTVRRLTPVECERLQAFPDGWTDLAVEGTLADFLAGTTRASGARPTPDGPRYKALGNSMSTHVMEWIGGRIDLCERLEREGRLPGAAQSPYPLVGEGRGGGCGPSSGAGVAMEAVAPTPTLPHKGGGGTRGGAGGEEPPAAFAAPRPEAAGREDR